MEKRLVLAIALSLLVLLGWSALVPKPQIVDNQGVVLNNSQVFTPTQETSSAGKSVAAISPSVDLAREKVKFTQARREIIFNPLAASITEVMFKDGPEHLFPLKIGLLTDGGFVFKQQNVTKDSISFIYEDANKRIIKKFTFPNNSHTIDLSIQTFNLSTSPLSLNQKLFLGQVDLTAKNPQSRYHYVCFGVKDGLPINYSVGRDFSRSDLKFIGLRDQYFCIIVEPKDMIVDGYVRKLSTQESEVGIFGKDVILQPKAQIGQYYRIYLGPQDVKVINGYNPEWAAIVDFGKLNFIAHLLLQLLGFFYSLVHNWGLAIIILSIAVYFLLFPLSIKQMRSMKEMQLLQPKIEALRKELKDNPQRLNKEIMELYKEHKVNPLGGCLPLLLQMPIFFALYQALIRSVALRGAHFLWIKDLSSPDKAFVFKNSIPLLGNQINVLPILMAIGMFVQQKISMAKASGDAAQQQQMMLIIMPIMFGVIFYQMPSGLVLYWFVNSLLMLAYQFRLNRQK